MSAAAAVSAVTIYVPRDSSARAVGADEVADTIAAEAARRGVAVKIVRNGSRGLAWLEPLVECATDSGRIGFGPVQPQDVAALFDAGFPRGAKHPLALGQVDELPYLKSQQRLTFARIGLTDPLSVEDYIAHEGFAGLRRALSMPAEAIVKEAVESGLRGRGGAAFPSGIKWQTAMRTAARPRYVVCNADEGDSGTFADRLIMESDPLALIEGMTIVGLAVDAQMGYIYVRTESGYSLRT